MKQIYFLLFSTLISCSLCAQSGNSLNFDGNNDYINIGNLIPTSSSYTIEAMINASDISEGTILSNSTSLIWFSQGTIYAGHDLPVGFPGYVGQDLSANSWNHVAVIYDATTATMTLYINGQFPSQNFTVGQYNSADIQIGALNSATVYNGAMDEVRIWNYARTIAEINHYKDCELTGNEGGLLAYYQFNQGVANSNNSTISSLTDSSSNNNNGTLINFTLNGNTSNWTDTSSITSGITCSILSTTNFETLNNNNNIKLFPNPSKNFIQVSSLAKPENYRLYNILGAEVKHGVISDTQKLNIQNLTNGLYFLKFEDGNILKFIKE